MQERAGECINLKVTFIIKTSTIRLFLVNKRKVKSACKPSGPSGQHFSPVSIATRSIFTPLVWDASHHRVMGPYILLRPGSREALRE